MLVDGGESPESHSGAASSCWRIRDGRPLSSATQRLRVQVTVAGLAAAVAGLAAGWSPWIAAASDGAWTITTVAGGGAGDHGPAANAALFPSQIAVDAAGDIDIADRSLARVRMIRGGVITTIAGTGDPGNAGDGGSATAAQIGADIEGIAADRGGNVFISDVANGCIRKIDAHGIITTFASGLRSPEGLAVDSGGNVYVAETKGERVLEYSPGGGMPTTVAGVAGVVSYYSSQEDGLPATVTPLYDPQGVAVDSGGNVDIADTGTGVIRRVDRTSGTMSAIATGLKSPQAVTIDHHGDIYVADTGDGAVLVINGGRTSVYTTKVNRPTGLAVSDLGGSYAVYVAFPTGIFYPNGSATGGSVIAGTLRGDAGRGELAVDVDMAPRAVALDAAGNMIVADATRILRVLASSGRVETVAGTGKNPWVGQVQPDGANVDDVVDGHPGLWDPEGLPATSVNIDPLSVVVSPEGLIYFGDNYTHRVLRIGVDGTLHDVTGGNGEYVGVPIITGSPSYGPWSGNGGPAVTVQMMYPSGLAFHGDVLYVADAGGPPSGTLNQNQGVVWRVSKSGTATIVAGGGATGVPAGSTTTQTDCYYEPYDAVPVDQVPATESCLVGPTGIAFDRAGDLYITEQGANRVRRVDAGGTITTVAGNGAPDTVVQSGACCIFGVSVPGTAPKRLGLFIGDGAPAVAANLDMPSGIVVDAAGNVFVADSANQVVREIDTSGTITTVAGDPLVAFEVTTLGVSNRPSRGDGGPAKSAYLLDPEGLTLDSSGNLLIADTADRRVRRVVAVGVAHHASPGSVAAGRAGGACAAADELVESAFTLAPHAATHRPARSVACTRAAPDLRSVSPRRVAQDHT